jgi:hypothetical protein
MDNKREAKEREYGEPICIKVDGMTLNIYFDKNGKSLQEIMEDYVKSELERIMKNRA